MKTLVRILEGLFIDIPFAEERESRSAREVLKKALKKSAQKVEDTFTAIAFAEAGEFETGEGYINKDGNAPRSRRTGSPTRRVPRFCAGRA